MDDVVGNIPDRWMRDEKVGGAEKKTNSLMVGITSGWADNWRTRLWERKKKRKSNDTLATAWQLLQKHHQHCQYVLE